MLDTALLFFQQELNSYIQIKTAGRQGEAVKFPSVELSKELKMQKDAITALMLNIEEERLFRGGAGARHQAHHNAGTGKDLCLNFHLLFIANFQDYFTSLKMLSLTLKFFQSYRTFSQQKFPALSADIQQLSTELVNLTFTEQGELWGALNLPCSPSALYKVKMLVFPDEALEGPGAAVENIQPLLTPN